MNIYSTRAISGFILFLSGLLCIMFPIMGALDVEAMLGVVILLSGIFHLVGAVEQRTSLDFIWSMLTSFALLGFGLFLLADPYSGVQLLSVIVFLFLFSHGLFTLGAALTQKSFHGRWFWTFFSAVLSLILAAIVFFGYPAGDQWTIGMLVGVALLGYGISLLVISGAVQSNDEESVEITQVKAVAKAARKPTSKKAAPKKPAAKKTTAKKPAVKKAPAKKKPAAKKK